MSVPEGIEKWENPGKKLRKTTPVVALMGSRTALFAIIVTVYRKLNPLDFDCFIVHALVSDINVYVWYYGKNVSSLIYSVFNEY